MDTYRIGSKTLFNTVFSLFSEHDCSFLKRDIRCVTENGERKIINGSEVFVLNEALADKESASKFVFQKNGGSWFNSFRNPEEINQDKKHWDDFIRDIVSAFRKEYGYLEFVVQDKERTHQEVERYRQKLDMFFDHFYPELKIKVRRSMGNDVQDYYGIVYKMQLGTGAGTSKYVICKSFLSYDKNRQKVYLHNNDVDDQINERLLQAAGEESHDVTISNEQNHVINQVLDEFRKSINLSTFSYVPASKEDEDILKQIVAFTSERKLSLKCSDFQILCIQRVKWHNLSFDAFSNNQRIFKCIMHDENTYSIYCANCELDEPILLYNKIPAYNDAEGKKKEYTFDFAYTGKEKQFTKETIDEIKACSVLAKHTLMVSCSLANFSHSRIVCDNPTSLFRAVDEDGVERIYCRNCRKPQIVYQYKGEPHLTKDLGIDYHRLELIPKDNTDTCQLCQRSFKVTKEDQTLCPACEMITSDDGSFDESINVFKTYSLMFTFITRNVFLARAKIQRAIDDKDIVIIRCDDRYYIFNKLEVETNGFIPGPSRVHYKKGGDR